MRWLAVVAVGVGLAAAGAVAQNLKLRPLGIIIPTTATSQTDGGYGLLKRNSPYAIQCDNTACFKTVSSAASTADCATAVRIEANYLVDFETESNHRWVSAVCYDDTDGDGGCGCKVFDTRPEPY